MSAAVSAGPRPAGVGGDPRVAAAGVALRVALLADNLGMGGAQRLLVPLAVGLRARGVDARVLHLMSREGNVWAGPLRAAGVPVVDLGCGSLLDPRPVLRLAGYLRAERVQVLHTHLRYADLVGRAAAALAGRPTVSTIHRMADHLRTDASRHDGLLRRLDYWSAGRWCATVVAVSEAQRAAYLRAGGAARVETHRNGVDTGLYRPDGAARAGARAELGVGAGEVLFATVAMLRPGKGVEDLLGAAARLRAPGARFVVVGDGAERGRLEGLAGALGVAGRVRFLGARQDVPRLLAGADAYVHPSLSEALPTSVLEAMASGLAVAATRVGGVPELVAEGVTGLLVDPGDPEGLAGALERLLDGGLRAELGAAGRAWVQQHASLEAWLAGLEGVYRRAAGGPA